MTQSTRTSGILALVGSTGRSDAPAEGRAAALRESFDGWLNSVAPTLLQSSATEKPAAARRTFSRLASLTSIDVVRVNRATVRESNVHRHWPPDVVTTFMAADVIKRNHKR